MVFDISQAPSQTHSLTPTASSYTGYIDVEARRLFVYFCESRNDPDKDDVILWTNGGLCVFPLIHFFDPRLMAVQDQIAHPQRVYSWNLVRVSCRTLIQQSPIHTLGTQMPTFSSLTNL